MTFKKGDEVTLVYNWDDKGTVAYRHAIVNSCGKKQMVLTSAVTGELLGRFFDPRPAVESKINRHKKGTFHRVSDDQAEAICLRVGANIVAEERVRKWKQIAYYKEAYGGGDESGYVTAMRKDIAAFHPPRALKRE